MSNLRRFEIALLNILILGWLVKEMMFSEVSDVLGGFILIVLILLIFYNIYALVIFNYFKWNYSNKIVVELIYLLLLLSPIMIFFSLVFYRRL